MQSNVKLYVDAGALIRGSRRARTTSRRPMPCRGRPLRAMVVFNNVENAGLRGAAPSTWRATRGCGTTSSPTPATARRDRRGAGQRSARPGVKGYIVNHCKNISFQGLLLLRSAYWTTTVSDTENFSAINIKIVNRKQQYHDDAFDFTGNSKHILVEDSFAMTMDDTFAFYGGKTLHRRGRGGEGICELHLYRVAWPSATAARRISAPALRGRALRHQPEQVRCLDSTDARVLYRQGIHLG
jgi:hypothetical protein